MANICEEIVLDARATYAAKKATLEKNYNSSIAEVLNTYENDLLTAWETHKSDVIKTKTKSVLLKGFIEEVRHLNVGSSEAFKSEFASIYYNFVVKYGGPCPAKFAPFYRAAADSVEKYVNASNQLSADFNTQKNNLLNEFHATIAGKLQERGIVVDDDVY